MLPLQWKAWCSAALQEQGSLSGGITSAEHHARFAWTVSNAENMLLTVIIAQYLQPPLFCTCNFRRHCIKTTKTITISSVFPMREELLFTSRLTEAELLAHMPTENMFPGSASHSLSGGAGSVLGSVPEHPYCILAT